MKNFFFGKAPRACPSLILPLLNHVSKTAGLCLLFFFILIAETIGKVPKVFIELKNTKAEGVFKPIRQQHSNPFSVITVEDRKPLIDQQKIVRGKVVGADGKGLAGATIHVKNSNEAVIADAQGNYSISVDGSAVLIFVYIGYRRQEVAVRNRSVVNVSLVTEHTEIEEVVVTGLGAKIDRRIFTGATTKVEMKDIELGGIPDPSRALEGRVAGVIVQNLSGTFGTAPKIRVRGATSIYGNSKPLWVVDGIIIEDVADVNTDDLSTGNANTLISSAIAGLNANDIESFQVLKDGSATSIYGARAMGGVIVITTKSGRPGYNSFNYTSEYTFKEIPDYSTFNIMNSQEQMGVYQFLEQRGWLNYADVVARSESGVYGKMYDLISLGKIENTQESKNKYLREAEYRNTDWFKELFNTSLMQNHSISFTSGTDKAQYYTSLSAVRDAGWTKSNNMKRYTSLINASYNLYENLKLGLRSNASYRDQRAPGTLGRTMEVVSMDVRRDFDINPYAYALNTSRTLDPQEYYRRNYAAFNILHELDNNYMDLNVADVKFQGELNWKALKYLDFGLMASVRYQQTAQQHHIKDQSNQALAYRANQTTFIRDKNPFLYKVPEDPYAVPVIVLPSGGIYNRTDYRMLASVIRFTAQFDKTFANVHRIFAFAGAERESMDRNHDWFRGWGLQYDMGEIPFLDYYLFKKAQEQNTDYFLLQNTRNRQAAFYGTANYTYDRRYTLSGTYRYEGTNRLGRATSSRWMPTWNISGAWNTSEESFFAALNTPIDKLSFKGSYSLTADRGPSSVTNSKIIIQSYNPWRPNTVDKETGLQISDLENSELTYEKKYELNLGTSMSLFQSRLNIDVDYYKRNNHDLIGLINTQGLGGKILKYGNVAKMKSQGLEIAIGGTIYKNTDFSWDATLNYARATNKVVDFEGRSRVADLIAGQGFAVEGYPVRSLFSIPFNRLDGNGLPIFNYIDGEETTTGIYFQDRDRIDFLKYEGPTDPTDIGGFSNSFNYKNLKLDIFITYSFGNVVRLDPVYRTAYTDLHATTREFWDAWAVPGDELRTNVPVILDNRFIQNSSEYGYAYNAYNYSDVNMASGDFIRLKNIALSYRFPKSVLQALKFSSLSLRLNAINPWLIYADKRLNGQDPEFVNAGGVALPIYRQYTLTLNVGL